MKKNVAICIFCLFCSNNCPGDSGYRSYNFHCMADQAYYHKNQVSFQ